MEHQREQHVLEQYATIAHAKIIAHQSDLDPKDHAHPDMLAWCRKQQDPIVVLESGKILTSQPSSRVVQNCKIVMLNKSITPDQVFPATSGLITILLENAEERADPQYITAEVSVTTQQQRLRLLVKEALAVCATDIHIQVREEIAVIRFRKHGELFLHAEWLPKLAREVVSVAFNKETDHSITHFNPLIPQNASMPLQIDNKPVRLRLASLPAHRGFDVVLRILTTSDERVASLENLGYLPEQVSLLKRAISMPYGAVIVAGPTGSGKTTTLASCMSVVDSSRKIYTIEDPVEKIIDGATQIPVNTEHYDRGFASMARTALRMDPDVIVLGEMRDEDTAAVMVRASITGHLVFSTVHTNSAVGIVTRLADFGVSRSLLASPDLLVSLVCQRLVPILCQHCAVSVRQLQAEAIMKRWQKVLSDSVQHIHLRGKCNHCEGSGISGRTVVAEIIWITDQDREFIQSGDMYGWQRHLKQNNWLSFGDRLIDLVAQGKVDPRDAEKIIGMPSHE